MWTEKAATFFSAQNIIIYYATYYSAYNVIIGNMLEHALRLFDKK